MIPNEDKEVLADLMKDAEIYAQANMRQRGEIPPVLLFHGKDGRGMLAPNSLNSDLRKDDFMMVARLTCLAHNAVASVMVAEAWMVKAKEGRGVDVSRPPSQNREKEEVVTILGETRHSQAQKFLPILRTEQGKFMGFGECGEIKADKVEGRFTQFIPPIVPDEQIQKVAMEALTHATISRDRENKRGWERGR